MKRRFPKKWLFAAVPPLLSAVFLFACAGFLRPAEAMYAAHIPAGIIKIKGEEKKEAPITVTASAKFEHDVGWVLNFNAEIIPTSPYESVMINGVDSLTNNILYYYSETSLQEYTPVVNKGPIKKGTKYPLAAGIDVRAWMSGDRPKDFKAYLTVDGQYYIFTGQFTFETSLNLLSAFPDPLVYSVLRDGDRLYLDIASGTYGGSFTASWTHKGMDLLTDGITVNKPDNLDAPYTASFTDSLNARESKRYVFLLSDAFEDGEFTIIYGDNKIAGPYAGSTVTQPADSSSEPEPDSASDSGSGSGEA